MFLTRRLLLAGAAAAALPRMAAADERRHAGRTVPGREAVGRQLILAVDVSSSITPERYALQQAGYIKALQDTRVMEMIKNLKPASLGITFIAWAVGQEILVPWTRVENELDMRSFCARLGAAQRPDGRRIGIFTNLASAMLYAGEQFDAVFTGPKTLDVSGDGAHSYAVASVDQARDTLVAQGVTINGLPILVPNEGISPNQPPEGLDVYYKRHVIGGRGAIMVASRGFENFFWAILTKLSLEIV